MVVLWVDQIQVEVFHRWLQRLRRLLVLLRQAKVKASTSQRVTRKKLKTWRSPHQQFVKPLLNFKIFLKLCKIQIYISKISFVSFTVFENHRKSLIQHCERIELCLHFEWTKVHFKKAKNYQFWRFFENLKFAVKQCYQTGQF